MIQKLKEKYGDVSDDESSSSESEDEDAEALTDKLEKQWFQTLSALKHKDPNIYDTRANLPKSYNEEQDNMKKSFTYAVGDVSHSDSGEEFLTKRKVSQNENEKQDEEFNKWLKENKPEK